MAGTRLSSAFDAGQLVLPDGPVRVLRPPADYDLSGLDKDRVEIAHGFLPDRDAWAQRGYAGAGTGKVPTVLIVVPRSKTHAKAMLLQAMAEATDLVIVDGQKTDGVDSLFKACKPWADIAGNVTKAHGRLFWFAPDAVPDWDVSGQVIEGFVTVPGGFSEGKIDRGSLLLVECLPPLKGRVADLGAGWGYLSRAILRNPDVTGLDMVEAEQLSLDCLCRNIDDPRATAHWADATRYEGGPYDTVVMNPPFHTGRQGAPDLGQAFIATAARIVKPRGQVILVANRHLPYEAALRQRFAQVEEIGGDGGFKIIRATRPKRTNPLG